MLRDVLFFQTTLSVLIELDKDGVVKSHKIEESIIKSVARLNYTNVYKVLCGEKADEKTEKVKDQLLLMNELSRILEEKELASGSLDFEIPEVQFIFDKDGRAVDFAKRERNDAHRLIENFMILANKVVAKEFYDKDIPFVYRVHLAPKKEKVENVIEYLKGLGVKTPSIPQQITPKFYQELLASVENLELSETINKVILRSMQKAIYQNQCLGHFGLALDYYCHFTSPIRRYPDLTIHRIIKETLHKKIEGQRISELETFTFEASAQSSLTEKNADKCEREVDDLWKAYLMRDRVGEEFVGLVGSVTNFGVFVELENTVEGMIKIEDLDEATLTRGQKEGSFVSAYMALHGAELIEEMRLNGIAKQQQNTTSHLANPASTQPETKFRDPSPAEKSILAQFAQFSPEMEKNLDKIKYTK